MVRLAGIEPAALRSGVRPGALQTGRFEFATCRFRPSNIALFHPGCYTVATRRRPAAKAKASGPGLIRMLCGAGFPRRLGSARGGRRHSVTVAQLALVGASPHNSPARSLFWGGLGEPGDALQTINHVVSAIAIGSHLLEPTRVLDPA